MRAFHGRNMAQTVTGRLLTAKARVPSLDSTFKDLTLTNGFFVKKTPSPVTIILPVLRIHLYLNTSLIRRTSGRKLGKSQQRNFLLYYGGKVI